jgi:chromosomal replication initiation ATPase DnaA|tara:strand:- start:361 stop:1014 length:654 start_codon:yes stop_codon:yes gene_type:complete
MSQLTFKFPFKATYNEKDFYVSSSNFDVYKLIENWPNWPSKAMNIFGPHGCGKTHLGNILSGKIKLLLLDAKDFNENILNYLDNKDCLLIDNFSNNIEENFLYSILNQITQTDKHILINSIKPIKNMSINLKDLKSRLDSFTSLGINLPTDDLLRVIITKSFSDKQIEVNIKLLEYILRNVDRSYEKIFKFVKDVDMASLTTGKSININLIKKVLNK